MAMKKRFYSVNGQMMGYESGGVKKDFLTDHLGSITAEIDQTQTRTYDTRYSAYGRNNWSTGTGCGFGWVGSYGYRETGLFHMSHYVRARHYSYVTGGWSTVDPLWPRQSAYGYVRGWSTLFTDRFGFKPNLIGCSPTQSSTLGGCCDKLKDVDKATPPGVPGVRDKIKKCMANAPHKFDNPATVDFFLNKLLKLCHDGSAASSVCIRCESAEGGIPKWPSNCPSPCKGIWGQGFPPPGIVIRGGIDFCGLQFIPEDEDCPGARKDQNGKPCGCGIVMCNSAFPYPKPGITDNGWQSPCAILYHEMAHCTGLGHGIPEPAPPPGIHVPRPLDFIYKLGCCICRSLGDGKGCGPECDRVSP